MVIPPQLVSSIQPQFTCIADTRVWLHVTRASGSRKLYTLFTRHQCYHIGSTNANLSTDKVIVQLSPVGQDLTLIHMNKFNKAISTDPDLSAIPFADRTKIFQALYIAIECDFTSFFLLLLVLEDNFLFLLFRLHHWPISNSARHVSTH